MNRGVSIMKPNYILKQGMKLLRIEKLRAHQLKPIQSLIQGNDTVVIAGTASGKSVIYQLSALVHSDCLTLVIEPTLSLIYNQVQSLQERGIYADYIDHFRTKKDVAAILHKAGKGKLTFLYITPERLQSRQFQEVMEHTHIYMIVIDECHCVTEWGNTFVSAKSPCARKPAARGSTGSGVNTIKHCRKPGRSRVAEPAQHPAEPDPSLAQRIGARSGSGRDPGHSPRRSG